MLLQAVAERAAEQLGAVHLHVEVTPGRPFLSRVAHRAEALARLVEDAPAKGGLRLSGAVFRAQVAGVGGELRFERAGPSVPGPEDIFAVLARLAELVRARRSAFVLTVDEAQVAMSERDGREELALLCAALQ